MPSARGRSASQLDASSRQATGPMAPPRCGRAPSCQWRSAPAHSTGPLLLLSPPPPDVSWRSRLFSESLGLGLPNSLRQGRETNSAPSLVHVLLVLELPGAETPALIPIQARAATLGTALIEADSVFEVRGEERRRIPVSHGLPQQSEAPSLKGGPADGILCDNPGRSTAVRSNPRSLGPPPLGVQDRFQLNGILQMDPLHCRSIPIEQ